MPALLLLISLFAVCGGCQSDTTRPEFQRVEIADETFDLELAMTPESRHQGLSGRTSIPADGGMLFVFPRERVLEFVMRDCLVPIDILFLGPTGKVIAMHEMQVEPAGTPERRLKRYSSVRPALFAIEVAEGSIRRLGVELGDQIDLPVLDLKRKAE
jgi:uncharacterized membrane protein (UPF0127 family)